MSKKRDWTEFKFEDFNDSKFLILHTRKKYEKGKKTWESKPLEEEYEVIKSRNYQNYITSIPYFNNFGFKASCKAVEDYTVAGYLPVRLHTISPDGETKLVDDFEFINIWPLYKSAGLREQEALFNAQNFRIECGWDKKILTLMYINKDKEERFAQFDMRENRWVG